MHKARHRRSGKIVAIKKIFRRPKDLEEGVSVNLLREVRLLKECRHPNVAQLLDVVVSEEIELDETGSEASGSSSTRSSGGGESRSKRLRRRTGRPADYATEFPEIHFVFDYVEFDLTALIDLARAGVLPPLGVDVMTCYAHQLLQALEYANRLFLTVFARVSRESCERACPGT